MDVRCDLSDSIAVVTFTNGDLNLYSLDLHDAFDAALDQALAAQPRAVLIRAEGKVVSAGVDVAQFHARKTKDDTRALYDRMLELPERIAAIDVPTFFAAHGLTLTWALEVALACDIVLASENARFGLVERVIGLTPTMGGTQRLAERAGIGRAKQVVFTGEVFGAETFERWNVINAVLPVDGFDDAVLERVRHVAVGPTVAFTAAKEILDHWADGGVTQAVENTTRIAADLFDTEDLQRGMESFLTDGPGKAVFAGH